MKKLWQMSKVKMGKKSTKSMKSRTQKGSCSKCVHIRTSGRGVEKFVMRYVDTKWMFPNKYCASASARVVSRQPAFMGRCLTTSHTCLPSLPSRLVSPGCFT